MRGRGARGHSGRGGVGRGDVGRGGGGRGDNGGSHGDGGAVLQAQVPQQRALVAEAPLTRAAREYPPVVHHHVATEAWYQVKMCIY